MRFPIPASLLLLLAASPAPGTASHWEPVKSLGAPAADAPGDPGFVLHEWGTIATPRKSA